MFKIEPFFRINAFADHADPKTTVRYDRLREDLDECAAYLIHVEED